MEWWVILLLVFGGLVGLWVAYLLSRAALLGAAHLLGLAAEQGFIGLAAYLACWVFFPPVMLVVCIVLGIFIMWAARQQYR